MGTNYYLGNAADPAYKLHVGKSPGGWCFVLRVYPDYGLEDIYDWYERWTREGTRIFDEYGKVLTPDEMLRVVTQRQWHARSTLGAMRDYAQHGVNNLLRLRVGRAGCVGHGGPTFDLKKGDFR